MESIKYLKGDASAPIVGGPKIIAHVVNDQGAWGAGFTKSLNEHWPKAGEDYGLWYQNQRKLEPRHEFYLGNVRYTIVRVRSDEHPPLWIAHMMAQEGLISRRNPRPLRYDALGACLLEVSRLAKLVQASVHMPRIGCGLAGGDWAIVEQLVHDSLTRHNIGTYVYDLEI